MSKHVSVRHKSSTGSTRSTRSTSTKTTRRGSNVKLSKKSKTNISYSDVRVQWLGNVTDHPWRLQVDFTSQSAAILHGRALAKLLKAELSIVSRRGWVRAKDSYGNDPCSTKG